MPPSVADAVGSAYEKLERARLAGQARWRRHSAGRAHRAARRGIVEVAHRIGGPPGSGGAGQGSATANSSISGAVLELVCACAAELFDGLDGLGAWDAVIEAEPALAVVLSDERFDSALRAIANFIDLKSPYTLGHSAAVAERAAEAGTVLGFPASDVQLLRRSGWVHNYGRLGVSNSIWDKRGPLGAGEWERVRMQPYFTERMLRQSPALAPLGAIAVQHRERPGWLGLSARASSRQRDLARHGRVLAVADAYQALREPRPHRAALDADAAGKLLRAEVRAGRLDADAVEALLGAPPGTVREQRRRAGPAGLTAREVEVRATAWPGVCRPDRSPRSSR